MTHLATVILLFALVLPGCVRAPGGVAPSNIPLEPGGYTVIGRVSGSDCRTMLLGLIPLSGGNQVADAMREALAERPGAEALVDISIDLVGKNFIIVTTTCTEVRATAVSVN